MSVVVTSNQLKPSTTKTGTWIPDDALRQNGRGIPARRRRRDVFTGDLESLRNELRTFTDPQKAGRHPRGHEALRSSLADHPRPTSRIGPAQHGHDVQPWCYLDQSTIYLARRRQPRVRHLVRKAQSGGSRDLASPRLVFQTAHRDRLDDLQQRRDAHRRRAAISQTRTIRSTRDRRHRRAVPGQTLPTDRMQQKYNRVADRPREASS